ncbi:MAG: FadR family transcriptional regulator [Kiritimatiellae bacterium]|nr:FadR family transcriptional regulator [Kiritimatiellia bacterium]
MPRRNVSDVVLDQIKNNILSGEWMPGTRIPPEVELVEMLGVSRISVREAIHRLVGMGVLRVDHGRGTFVSDNMPPSLFNVLLPMLLIEPPQLREVLEFRSIVEIESARLAAMRAGEEHIRQLEETLVRMKEKAGDVEGFAAEDLNFHMVIAAATRNPIIIKVNSILHDVLRKGMRDIVSIVKFEPGLLYHARILEAIRAKDGEEAARLMSEHLHEARSIAEAHWKGAGQEPKDV